jgi:hypothetical protein
MNKKEHPINGLERDATSKYWRKTKASLVNNPDLVKFAKSSINKRFRRKNKHILLHLTEEE